MRENERDMDYEWNTVGSSPIQSTFDPESNSETAQRLATPG